MHTGQLSPSDEETMSKHLEDLRRLPDMLWKKLIREGLSAIHVGPDSIVTFSGYEHLAQNQAPGHPSGVRMRDIPCAYDRDRRVVLLGTKPEHAIEASLSPALHEIAHALGSIMGYDEDVRLKAAHDLWHKKNRLNFPTSGAAAKDSIREFFANSFEHVILNAPRVVLKFGAEYVDFIRNDVLHCNSPKRG